MLGTVIFSIVSDMPSGKAHLRIEVSFLAIWSGLGAYLILEGWGTWPLLAVFGVCYVASMALLSPDLDLVGSRPFKRWGPLRVLWWPYATVFRHRKLSHHWFFGPLTRVGYILAWVIVAGVAVGWISARDLEVRLPNGTLVAAIALGLYLPNATHIVADAIHTAAKRRRRKRER
ncbi:MAG: DUF2227 family putative metal-binding protein [Candidatus Bipolaricaulis sp.]|nr:DUF2227 family putative metal-binding protein [Candidatus Bipolaricaulis sp.]